MIDDDCSRAVEDRGRDVALVDANLLWTPNAQMYEYSALMGQASVEDRNTPSEKSRYTEFAKSWGACAMWSTWSSQERITELLRISHVMTTIHGIKPDLVHQAFAVIPEYRQLMVRYIPEWADEFGEDSSHG